MRNRPWLVLMGLIAMPPAGAAATPEDLLGNSVIVTWREDRRQRVVGKSEIRSLTAKGTYQIYFSPTDKAFGRLTFALPNRKGALKSGKNDKVTGENSGREPLFSQSGDLNITWIRGEGGATTIDVKFEDGFRSCTARVVTGKTGGASAIRAKSIIDKTVVEIYSALDGDETCKVQSGNVFGN